MKSNEACVRRIATRTTDTLPDGAVTRARGVILRAALRLFAERGYSGASIRDIAAASGVRHATLYSHYPSKEHVLAELALIGHREHLGRVRSALLDSQPDPKDQIVGYIRAHVSVHTDFPMLAVVANSELHMLSRNLGAAAFELRNQSEKLLVGIIQRGVDKGVFRVPHVWLATAAIAAMGLRVAYWYTPEFEVTAERLCEIYAEYALRILSTGEAAGSRA